ncbi:hypothetical protein [Chryseobacterium sp. OSA05B]|uniref:hypothetical protein n=1 Tax=Chryseobacterium sp. OSA05B TaxID=2862650 RepID=UPI001CBCDA05|nr:hypothetical protein [Chryseobacterium sp. OSA05B]
MNILKGLELSGTLIFATNSCTQKPATIEKSVVTEKKTTTKIKVDGSYLTPDYQKEVKVNWVGIIIQNIDDHKISVKIRSRADKKKTTCTLYIQATKSRKGIYQATLEGKNVVFTFHQSSVTVSTEYPKDKYALRFYCSGRATIADTYTTIIDFVFGSGG